MEEYPPLLSVIIPTYNEVENIPVIIPTLSDLLEEQEIPHEIIVMDDSSPDGTGGKVEELSKEYDGVRCITRITDRGLSPAVIDGFEEAIGDVYLVMDADMSHPPEIVPEMYRTIVSGEADIVVGSRRIKGGGIENWPLSRKVISRGASLLARPLTSCSDPMSGFFALRPQVVANAPLKPKGYKILLEILVKGRYDRLKELPITFKDRELGKSKLGGGVIFHYLIHLFHLYIHPGSASLVKFLFVGGSGILIDLGLFTLMLSILGEGKAFELFGREVDLYLVYQAISFSAAVTWNFFWNRYWTFNVRSGSKLHQYTKFFIVALTAFGLRTGLMYLGGEFLGFGGQPFYQILLVTVIFIVTIVNYLGSKLWAFQD